MRTYDTIFLDRDGTLNPDPGYISKIDDFDFFPFTIDALKIMSKITDRFCIISNQSGISRGLIKEEALLKIHDHIQSFYQENGLNLLGIYYCPDHPDNASNDRKPGTGMFEKAAQEHDIDLSKCLMVGDAGSDIEAGDKLEMDTMLVLTGKGAETVQNLNKDLTPTFVVENLLVGGELITS